MVCRVWPIVTLMALFFIITGLMGSSKVLLVAVILLFISIVVVTARWYKHCCSDIFCRLIKGIALGSAIGLLVLLAVSLVGKPTELSQLMTVVSATTAGISSFVSHLFCCLKKRRVCKDN